MPEITIREIDNTVGYVDEQDYVVFVPGNVSSNDEGETQEEKELLNSQYKYIGERTLFTNLTDFLNAIGRKSLEYRETEGEVLSPFVVVDGDGTTHRYDPGYLYARFLLSKGYSIYYGVPKGDINEELLDGQEQPFSDQTIEFSVGRTIFEQGGNVQETQLSSEGVYYEKSIKNGIAYNVNNAYLSASGDAEASTIPYNNLDENQKADWWDDGHVTIDEVDYDTLKCSGTTYVDATYGKTVFISTYAGVQSMINNETFWTDLDDKSLYQFRYLITGGYVVSDKTTQGTSNDITAMSQIITIANTRGDCIGLLDHTRNLSTKNDIISAAQRVTSKYCTMFSPWCSYTINNLSLPMPASMAYLEAFINGVQNNPTWYAMAGRLRGTITGTPIKQYGEKFANSLMSDTGVSVNPITNVYPYGILIWGNRTLNNNSGLVASSFLNIRQLCVDIFKSLYINAKGYMFEQNSDRLWFNFKSNIAKLLDNMKSGEGISGYRIIRLEPERAKVRALIRIVPLEAVEKFDLTVELNDSLISTNE